MLEWDGTPQDSQEDGVGINKHKNDYISDGRGRLPSFILAEDVFIYLLSCCWSRSIVFVCLFESHAEVAMAWLQLGQVWGCNILGVELVDLEETF